MEFHNLPEVLRYDGEYGTEIITFIPFINWLNRNGYMRGRKVSTYAGMWPYYFFLDKSQVLLREEPRSFMLGHERWWPNNSEHLLPKSEIKEHPDYRSHYKNSEYVWDKPILFVQNKFQIEWYQGPINYIDISTLQIILETLSNKFQIIYSRPGINAHQSGYIGDNSDFCSYPDRSVITRFPNVIIFEDLAAGGQYNEIKLKILANAHHFLAVQGGGTYLLTLFGDSLLIVLHRLGREYRHSYWRGFYTYAGNSPPTLLVARNSDEFERCIDLLTVAPDMPGQKESYSTKFKLLLRVFQIYQLVRRIFWFHTLDEIRARGLRVFFRWAGGMRPKTTGQHLPNVPLDPKLSDVETDGAS